MRGYYSLVQCSQNRLNLIVKIIPLVSSLIIEQAEPVKESGQKRKGPLPLWAAELAVFGLYAALFASVTKFQKESAAVGTAVGNVIKAAAKKANLI